MDQTGKVTTYINQRGDDKTMIPRWLKAGVTHAGMGQSIGADRSGVVFGRIFGDNSRADVSIRPSYNRRAVPLLRNGAYLRVVCPHLGSMERRLLRTLGYAL